MADTHTPRKRRWEEKTSALTVLAHQMTVNDVKVEYEEGTEQDEDGLQLRWVPFKTRVSKWQTHLLGKDWHARLPAKNLLQDQR